MKVRTTSLATAGIGSEPRTRHGLGLCGLVLAVVGLTLAIARPYVAEIFEPPPPAEPRQKLSKTLAEAGSKFVDRILDKARGRAAAPQGRAVSEASVTEAALVAISLGCRHVPRLGRLALGHGRLDTP